MRWFKRNKNDGVSKRDVVICDYPIEYIRNEFPNDYDFCRKIRRSDR